MTSANNTIDLRRRLEPGLVDLILLRAEYLPRPDRALLEAYYRQSVSAGDLAALERRSVRSVRNSIRRLSARVLDDMFVFIMRSRDQLAPTRRRIAEAVFVRGLSRRQAASALGISLHTIRLHCQAVEELARADERRSGRAA